MKKEAQNDRTISGVRIGSMKKRSTFSIKRNDISYIKLGCICQTPGDFDYTEFWGLVGGKFAEDQDSRLLYITG